MTDARKHLSKGLMSLIRQTPFYTNLLIRNEIVECDELDSFMATDGKRLIFNSSILQCNTKEMAEILKHEAMHIANKHHIRGKQLEKQYEKEIEKYGIDFRMAFNIAADLAINSLLRANYELTWRESDILRGGCIPGFSSGFEDFPENKTCEFYFDMIVDMAKQAHKEKQKAESETESTTQQDDSFADDVKKAITGESENTFMKGEVLIPEESDEQLEKEFNVNIARASIASKQAGEKSEIIDAILSEMVEEKTVNWRAEIQRFFSATCKGKPNYKKPNRRFSNSEFIFPSNKEKQVNEIVLLLDTSGSMSDECISMVYDHIEQILAISKETSIRLIHFDEEPFKEYESVYNKSNIPINREDISRLGCGGTQYCNSLDYATSHQPSGIIMLTDMMPYDDEEFEKYVAKLPILFISTMLYNYNKKIKEQYCTEPSWCNIAYIKKEN